MIRTNHKAYVSFFDTVSHAILDLARIAFARMRTSWVDYQAHRERRDAFKTLLRLDQKALKDIGLTRYDVLWASKLPLHVNAAEELQKIRNQNRFL